LLHFDFFRGQLLLWIAVSQTIAKVRFLIFFYSNLRGEKFLFLLMGVNFMRSKLAT